jgi:hypothetical protein
MIHDHWHLATASLIFFFSRRSCICLRQPGGALFEKTAPLPPPQKLLIITAKMKKQVLSLLAMPDHVK